MTNPPAARFHGIYPSIVCPMTKAHGIDEEDLARHLRDVTEHDGLVGVLANGHAGENFVLTRAEKKRVVEITREILGESGIVVAGVNAESSLEAANEARDAADAGADAVMVFPPNSWALSQSGRMALTHHQHVDAASDLPMMLFQGSVKAGQTAYQSEVLAELVRISSVVGIKEGSWETSAYEANRRLIKEVAPHVAVMASGDEHLLTSYVLGSDGSLVSLAVVIPQTIVALDRAVREGDLATAREMHEIVYPLARAIYGTPPGGRAAPRLKACLRLLGRLSSDHVRPPMERLSRDEETMLAAALRQAGLLPSDKP